MQRVTIAVDDDLLAEIDRQVVARGYQNRSEAIRDLARSGLGQSAAERPAPGSDCVAALVYVYDHESRRLSQRLTESFHEHHDLSLATMHVHLDHESCMEVNVLRGAAGAVQHLADHVIAERGVRHGRLVAIPVRVTDEKHAHGHSHGHHSHDHEPGRRHPHVHVKQAT
jgi:CopG family nickel-responsive transcriptional regulator